MTEKVITDKNVEEFASKLADQSYFDQVAFIVDYLTESPSSGEAFRFMEKLQRTLKKSVIPDDLRKKYAKLVLRLRFIAIPMLELTDAAEMLQNNIIYALFQEVDLRDRISRFLSRGSAPENLSRKSVLLQAIEKNLEQIGQASVSNWISEFKKTIGEHPGTLEVVKFITANKSASTLDEISKEQLKNILFFYNWLRFNSIENVQASGKEKSHFPIRQVNIPKPPALQEQPRTEATAFEKRLAEVSSQHGADLEVVKKKMEEAAGNGRTTTIAQDIRGEIKKEVLRTKPAVIPPSLGPSRSSGESYSEEVAREVATKELPAHEQPKVSSPSTNRDAEFNSESKKRDPELSSGLRESLESRTRIVPPPPIKPGIRVSQNYLKNLDDLKKISVDNLRQGSLLDQVREIKSRILDIARNNKMMPYQVSGVFEQSPLFQEYLEYGRALMNGRSAQSDLSREEFEAIADLKRQIEQM